APSYPDEQPSTIDRQKSRPWTHRPVPKKRLPAILIRLNRPPHSNPFRRTRPVRTGCPQPPRSWRRYPCTRKGAAQPTECPTPGNVPAACAGAPDWPPRRRPTTLAGLPAFGRPAPSFPPALRRPPLENWPPRPPTAKAGPLVPLGLQLG